MFIEISPLEGVFESAYQEELEPLAESYRLNLNFIRKVFFGKKAAYEKGDGSISWRNPYQAAVSFDIDLFELIETKENRKEREKMEEREVWQKYNVKKITLNQITFEVTSWDDFHGNFYNEAITLYFTKEGEGEYQRIKRIIDENTSR